MWVPWPNGWQIQFSKNKHKVFVTDGNVHKSTQKKRLHIFSKMTLVKLQRPFKQNKSKKYKAIEFNIFMELW